MPAEREVAVDPVHQRRQPQLVELRDLVTSARLELEPGERRAAPERQRLPETLGGALELALRDELLRLRNEDLHAARIEPLRLDVAAVAAGRGRDRIGAGDAERLAQLREIDVDRLARGRRRRLPPQVVDQALARDELVRVQEQDTEDELAPSASRARPVLRPRPPRAARGSETPRCGFTASQAGLEGSIAHRPNPVLAGLLPRAVHPERDGKRRVSRRGVDGRQRLRHRPPPDRGRAARAAARVRAARPRTAEQRPCHRRTRGRPLHDRDRPTPREGRLAIARTSAPGHLPHPHQRRKRHEQDRCRNGRAAAVFALVRLGRRGAAPPVPPTGARPTAGSPSASTSTATPTSTRSSPTGKTCSG